MSAQKSNTIPNTKCFQHNDRNKEKEKKHTARNEKNPIRFTHKLLEIKGVKLRYWDYSDIFNNSNFKVQLRDPKHKYITQTFCSHEEHDVLQLFVQLENRVVVHSQRRERRSK